MTILGIETSCDETALALIETKGVAGTTDFQVRVISSLIHSQAELHSAYGGVFPNLAKREHGKNLVPLLKKLLDGLPLKKNVNGEELKKNDEELKKVMDSFHNELVTSNPDLLDSFAKADFLKNIPDINAIAVTEGPGLEPTLWVGINFARILGALWNVPIIPINHMEGHVVGSLLEDDKALGAWQSLKTLQFPALAFLISGAHTELVDIENKNGRFNYKILGQTKDDAVGEAFDKVARLLNLPYPGGPHISKMAHEAYESKIESQIKLPRPMINSNDLNFSFSGLKTAVLYAVKKAQEENKFDDNFKKGLAYEFEQAVNETLCTKLKKAIEQTKAKAIIVGGGVSANHVLRKSFTKIAEEYGIQLFLPSPHISGDNALMIALAGALDINTNDSNSLQNKSAQKHILRAHGTKKLGLE
jgi:N6-L-threonylcarbamoyladenine synthase